MDINNNGGYSNSSGFSGSGSVNSSGTILWELCIGLFLIIVQFVSNKSFVGVSVPKIYFDLVFFSVILLIVVNARRDFMKMFLVVAGTIYVSSLIINHFNIIDTLVRFLPLRIGGADISAVLYYCIIMIIPGIFARAILKDPEVDVIGYSILGILSILIPYILVNVNVYSGYLIALGVETQGTTLFHLFFSIPILWQPFWISAIFKSKNNNSKLASIFVIFWLFIILAIFTIWSFYSVPVSAREGLQVSGKNNLEKIGELVGKSVNDTKNFWSTQILGFQASDEIENKIDSRMQEGTANGLTFDKIEFSEGDIIEFDLDNSESIPFYNAWATISGNINDGQLYNINITCELVLKGNDKFFISYDIDKDEYVIPGKINEKDYYTSNFQRIRFGDTITCEINKNDIISNYIGDKLEIEKNMLYTDMSIRFKSNFSFSSSGYLTKFYMDEELYRSEKISSSTYIDDYDILIKYGVVNPEEYQGSKYTGGPLNIGLKLSNDNLIIPINEDSSSRTVNFIMDFALDSYTKGLKVNNIKEIIVLIPKNLEIDGSKCTPIKLNEIIENQINVLKENNIDENYINSFTIFKVSDGLKEIDEDTVKKISCPVTLKNSDGITQASIGIFAKYNASFETSKSIIEVVFPTD